MRPPNSRGAASIEHRYQAQKQPNKCGGNTRYPYDAHAIAWPIAKGDARHDGHHDMKGENRPNEARKQPHNRMDELAIAPKLPRGEKRQRNIRDQQRDGGNKRPWHYIVLAV
jgi:hypothetical protein